MALNDFLKGQVESGGQRLGQMRLMSLALTTLAPDNPAFVLGESLGARGPACGGGGGGGFCFHLCF